jgi:hypothetical protein
MSRRARTTTLTSKAKIRGRSSGVQGDPTAAAIEIGAAQKRGSGAPASRLENSARADLARIVAEARAGRRITGNAGRKKWPRPWR